MALTTSAIRVAIRAALDKGETYSSIASAAGMHYKTVSKLDDPKVEDVELKLSQIESLHRYLSGLQLPILAQPGIATAIQSSDEVQVIVPIYRNPDEYRRLCSPWDVLAADRIRSPLESGALKGRTALRTIVNDQEILPEPASETVSQICVGSPRATCLFDAFATRLTMFGSESDRDTIQLTFRFYWRDYESRSPFVITFDEISVEFPELLKNAQFMRARAALVFNDHREPLVEISNLDYPLLEEFFSYGVVLTRWVSERSVWSCVAGLTGPSTEAAALRYLSFDFAVPRPKQADELADTPLAIHIIKVPMTVPPGPNRPDDLRSIQSDRIDQVGSTEYLFRPTGRRRDYD